MKAAGPAFSESLRFCSDLKAEYDAATAKYGYFASAHEGWAVLYEEVDELWDEVRKKRSKRDPEAMYRECVQIAAMALKFAVFVLKGDRK